jgi:acetyl esterase/lipase
LNESIFISIFNVILYIIKGRFFMRYEKYSLNEQFPMLKSAVSDFEPTLTAYLPDNTREVDLNYKRPTVIVCPGGGYVFTSDREAEPVALSFVGDNFNAFVLRYSVAPARYPQALLELSAAVAFVRRNAEKFNVDVDAITVCGFSAGGHLSASYGVFWDEAFIKEKLGIISGENKPNGMILAYPVITSDEFAHRGSFNGLLGDDASKELEQKMSIEKQVSDKTPPAFIWHTFNDSCVPVQNALLLANALTEHNIPYELHIYPDGPHGLSLCDSVTAGNNDSYINNHCKSWIYLCKEWLELNFCK